MTRLWSVLILGALGAACSHQEARPCLPVPCLPQPYWEPPAAVSPLPEEPAYLIQTLAPLTRESSDDERRQFLQAFAMDLLMCRGDSAKVRHLYEELERLVKTEPE